MKAHDIVRHCPTDDDRQVLAAIAERERDIVSAATVANIAFRLGSTRDAIESVQESIDRLGQAGLVARSWRPQADAWGYVLSHSGMVALYRPRCLGPLSGARAEVLLDVYRSRMGIVFGRTGPVDASIPRSERAVAAALLRTLKKLIGKGWIRAYSPVVPLYNGRQKRVKVTAVAGDWLDLVHTLCPDAEEPS